MLTMVYDDDIHIRLWVYNYNKQLVAREHHFAGNDIDVGGQNDKVLGSNQTGNLPLEYCLPLS